MNRTHVGTQGVAYPRLKRRTIAVQTCLLLLLALSLSCCKSAPEESPGIRPQQQAIWFLNKENHRLLQIMSRNIEERGNRAMDLEEKQKAAELIERRDAYRQGSLGGVEYTAYLTEAYSKTDKFEEEQAANLSRLLSRFRQSKDSAAYHDHLLSALLLENEVLQEHVKRAGPVNVLHPPTARLIKTTDTLQLGDTYEFSVLPAVYDYRKTKIVPDTTLQLRLNGKLVSPESYLRLQSGILLGSIHPTEAGTYTLSGSFTLLNPDYGMEVNSHFTDSFEVIAGDEAQGQER